MERGGGGGGRVCWRAFLVILRNKAREAIPVSGWCCGACNRVAGIRDRFPELPCFGTVAIEHQRPIYSPLLVVYALYHV